MTLTPDLLTEGRARRDAGLAVASTPPHRRLWIAEGQLRLLDALAAPGQTATTDAVADDLAAAFADGGRWRGAIPLGLAAAGLIERVGYVASCRPSRHGGPVSVWRLNADPDAVQAYRRYLTRLVADLRQPSGN